MTVNHIHKQNSGKNSSSHGFTLVEFALSVVIIGFILAVVLQVGDMIENATLKSTVVEAETLKSAIKTFEGKYNALPGDFREATTRLNACSNPVCQNGNGNGRIGEIVAGGQSYPGDYAEDDRTDLTDESAQTWQHLLRAGLISNVSSDPLTLQFGISHPPASLKGGFDITYIGCGIPAGHWLVLREDIVTRGLVFFTTPGRHPARERQARSIDEIYDDGVPESGHILALPNDAVGLNCASGGTYGSSDDLDCTLWFQLSQDNKSIDSGCPAAINVMPGTP